VPDRHTAAERPEAGMYIHYHKSAGDWILRVDHVGEVEVGWSYAARARRMSDLNLWDVSFEKAPSYSFDAWRRFMVSRFSSGSYTVTILQKPERKRKWRI
jgi:hypothetical protein